MDYGGIYLFSENGEHLYVGRTKNFRNRYRAHCGSASTENRAAFAFRLARIKTSKTTPSCKKEGGRKALMQDEVFAAAFKDAKSRIGRMEVRFIKEENDIRQALLEIYVALQTGAKHNTFSTT